MVKKIFYHGGRGENNRSFYNDSHCRGAVQGLCPGSIAGSIRAGPECPAFRADGKSQLGSGPSGWRGGIKDPGDFRGSQNWVGGTCPTVATSVRHLTELGIVRELTGKEWHRLFVYDEYLKILNEGTEPLL